MIIFDEKKLVKNPLVSVGVFTYNQEQYIEQCLDSILSQKTTFEYEIIIGEDCGTDRTRAICIDYQKRYPDRFKRLLHDNNHGMMTNFSEVCKLMRGKYMADMDGDDYWVDELKLQKQVDFLESHPEYGCCCTRYRCYHQQSGTYDDTDRYVDVLKEGMVGLEMNHDNYFAISQIPQLLTAVYRTDIFPPDAYYYKLKNQQDDALFYCMTLYSKIWLMNEVTGVYRKHDNSATWEVEQEGNIAQVKMLHDIFTDCWQYDKSESLREVVCVYTLQLCYSAIKYGKYISFDEWKQYLKEYKSASHSLREFLHIIKRSKRALAVRAIKRPNITIMK